MPRRGTSIVTHHAHVTSRHGSRRKTKSGGPDIRNVVDVAGYLLRAPRRQPGTFGAFLLVSTLLAATIFGFYPRTYSTDVKILAQRNLVLPALGNPNRTVPREADNPTKNVADAILQHDNLVGLIKQVNLVDRWEATRPAVLRLKDRVSQNGWARPQTEEDRLRSIEGVLEKRLVVTNDDNDDHDHLRVERRADGV